MRRTTQYDALIVGGGVAGLTAAVMLADQGARVAVLDRDGMAIPSDSKDAWTRWRRPWAPQLRHLHGYRARLRKLLLDHVPDMVDNLMDSGATELPLLDPLRWKANDPDLTTFACRFTTYCYALHRTAASRAGIRALGGHQVSRLLVRQSRGSLYVAGLECANGLALRAPVVINASGRRLPHWLTSVTKPRETRMPGSTAYVCRYYAYRDSAAWYRAGPSVGRIHGRTIRIGIYPAEAPIFAVGITIDWTRRLLRLLRSSSVFDAAIAEVRFVAEAVDKAISIPLGPVYYMGHLASYLRTYADFNPAVGFFALGDAQMAVNPAHGRGVTLATIAAMGLAETFRVSRGDLRTAMENFRAFLERHAEPWFWDCAERDALSFDQERPSSKTTRPDTVPSKRSLADAEKGYPAALRIQHMLDLPGGELPTTIDADDVCRLCEGSSDIQSHHKTERRIVAAIHETAGIDHSPRLRSSLRAR